MNMMLSEHERRVIGVLLEKSMAQPEYYPMTAHAVVAACNQRNNRDPIMELDEVAVSATLDALRKRGLVEQILPAPGARTDRFKHKIDVCFGWGPRERAIVAELLLRGPQTPGELRSRGSRLVAFEDLDAIHTVLEALRTCEPPVVAPLPREPGQSAIRFTHLFYPEGEQPTVAHVVTTAGRCESCAPPGLVRPSVERAAGATSPGGGDLARLEAELAEWRSYLLELARRVEALEAGRNS
ncbi:MAG TPA: YceH family protein [Phycisphaerae bacterium]|nr:YceH family protein [Phycisphaerae bacterium]HRY67298.1 YceH family protein [Phycisphaerae bacterium]HSA28441.1 YceH family protein [Phycisphaerae bacterium]